MFQSYVPVVAKENISVEAAVVQAPIYYPNSEKTYESDVYNVKIDLQTHAHLISIRIPRELSGQSHEKLKQKALDLIAAMPVDYVKSVDVLRFNKDESMHNEYWADSYSWPEFKAAATAQAYHGGERAIDYYPGSYKGMFSNRRLSSTTAHELGHLVAYKLWGSWSPPERWQEAQLEDQKFVSNYAQYNRAEDFAETVMVYLKSDGGRRNSALRQRFSARFKVLDEIFSVQPDKVSELEKLLVDRSPYYRNLRLLISGASLFWLFGDSVVELFSDEEGAKRAPSLTP